MGLVGFSLFPFLLGAEYYPYGLRGRVSDLKGELDAALTQIDSVEKPPFGS